MTNADLQTVGILLQAALTAGLIWAAWKGLSAWKAQSRASYRLEVLRLLSREAFCVFAQVHDARGLVHRHTRPEDVVNWPNELKEKTASVLRQGAERISHSNDVLLQTLVEARGGWDDNTSVQRLGKALACRVRDIHGVFGTLIMMLESQSPGAIVDEASQRKAVVRVCLGKGEPEPTPETEQIYAAFNAFLRQIEDEFRILQK